MKITNTNNSYGFVAIFLHWLSALLVIGLFTLGFWMVRLDYYDPWYTIGPYWHMGIGILLALLLLLRFTWKMINPKPHSITPSSFMARLIEVAHYSLYGLLLAIIVTGYLVVAADSHSFDVLGLFELPVDIVLIDNQETLMGNWHRYLAYGLALVVALHITAALKHHFIEKDATLRRMLGRS